MAKQPKKKAAKKSATPPARKKTIKSKGDQPIRIILEVIIKDERSATTGGAAALLSAPNALLGGAGGPTIKYQLSRTQITLLRLDIGDKTVANPPDSGSVSLDSYPLSGQIHVYASATGGSPQSTGTLQLTCNQKNLFNPAEPFVFTGSAGTINTTAKL